MLCCVVVVQSGDSFSDGWKGCGALGSCASMVGLVTGAQDPGGLGTECMWGTGRHAFSPPLIFESLYLGGDESVPDGLLQ